MKNILFLMFILFNGCSNNILSVENIQTIVVTRHLTMENPEVKTYLPNSELIGLLEKINASTNTPLKFLASYRIDLVYKDNSEIAVLINNNSLKINGKTFLCNEEFEKLLEKYFVSH